MTPRALPLSTLLLVAGCLGDDGTTPVALPPEIRAGTVASNPDNVIAAMVFAMHSSASARTSGGACIWSAIRA